MKIFFDFYEIALGKGKSIGIYNYALAVLKNLASKHKNLQIVVACTDANRKDIVDIQGIKLRVISDAFPNSKQRLRWRLYGAIKESKKVKADIYYSPKGFAPGLFKRKRKPFIVLTVHDMIPFYYKKYYPNYFSAFENHFITKSLKYSVKIANKVITISDFSKQMILKYCSKYTDIRVVYNGVSVMENIIENNTTASYIFAITSNLPHKNKDVLIDGYLEYREKTTNPLPLVICGISSEQLNIKEEEKGFIECIQFAGATQFSNLFVNASLFLFLPKIEGFAFPPIEALIYGVPPVVSNIPVLKEVLGQSAYFVNSSDPKNIGEGIKTVLLNHKIADNILLLGKETITKYTWKNCCNQIVNVFEETLNSIPN